jgi:hypothetical protein
VKYPCPEKVKEAYVDLVEFNAVNISWGGVSINEWINTHFPTYIFSICINGNSFAKLPKTYQSIMKLSHSFGGECKGQYCHASSPLCGSINLVYPTLRYYIDVYLVLGDLRGPRGNLPLLYPTTSFS